MAGNSDLILAGVKATGTGGTSLSWWAPYGSMAPTNATSSLDAAFKDGGLITQDGISRGVAEDQQDIKAYGLFSPARTLVSGSKVTFTMAFMESNPVSLAVYHRLDLGAIVPSTGAFDFTEGQSRTIRYAMVIDMVDGDNRVRAVCPAVSVTDRKEFAVKSGEAVEYGVTLTAYPGSDGTAVHWYYSIPALA